jgi:thiol-disulfide isomerase/thioredoxin
MIGKRIRYFLIVSLLGCVTLFFNPSTSFATTSLDFALVNIQNNQVLRSTDFKDKTIVVNFFSIYCKSCIKLIPALNMTLDRFQSSKFLVVGINIDRSTKKEEIKGYIAKHQIRFPVLLDGYNLAQVHNVFMLPTVFILGLNGKIEKKSFGLSTYKRLAEELSKLGVPLKKEQGNKSIP